MKTMKKGFTLIELMIVIAIIAIIAAIAIPNLMQSRIQANETNAIAALKAYATAQSIWLKGAYSLKAAGATAWPSGYSRTGPVYDAKVKQYAFPFPDLHFLQVGDGSDLEPVSLISSTFAGATEPDTAWNGYFFTELKMDKPQPNTFDLCTGPAVYSQTGNNSYKIDQAGTVKMTDLGTAKNSVADLKAAIAAVTNWIDA